MDEPNPTQPSMGAPGDAVAKLYADQEDWQRRAALVQSKAALSYARLISIAEEGNSGQAQSVAAFLAATYNGQEYAFNLFDLRALDVQISDDILICIDALRWGETDLGNLVPDGFSRVEAAIQHWGIQNVSK